jgi:hypothetical protein
LGGLSRSGSLGHGLGDGGGDLDAALDLVVRDGELEGVEYLALELGWCAVERLAQVGEACEQRGGVLGGHLIGRAGLQGPELDFGLLLVAAELGDALADQLWLEALLERLDLEADAPAEVGDLVT